MADATISPFSAFLADRYHALKATHENYGRRKLKLTLANDFWKLDQENKDQYIKASNDATKRTVLLSVLEDIHDDDDELDYTLGMGIIVRTDYSNDTAWESFVSAVKDAEKDLVSPEEDQEMTAGSSTEGSTTAINTKGEPDSESEEEMDADNGNDERPSPVYTTEIFTLINPPPSTLRDQLTGISNLAALRLFNDVDIIHGPKPPQGAQRIRPGNRIMDLDDLLEVYMGDLVWVYDAQSNRDQSVRLVNQRCEKYGTATADSWRPRVSFLPELQINLTSGAMKIDFGGLDRWDFNERQRNMAEIEIMP